MNELLHAIVSRLPHASEAEAEALHAMVDTAAPTPDAEPADAEAGTPDTPPKGK